MKRPSYISPFEWERMTPEEQADEVRLLQLEDEPAPTATREPSPPKEPREPVRRAPLPKWCIIQPQTIAQAFEFDPDTGHLYRRAVQRCANLALPDQVSRSPWPISTLHPLGFIVVKFKGRQHYAHRIAWLLMTGEEPRSHIRHANGNRADNRWINLTQ